MHSPSGRSIFFPMKNKAAVSLGKLRWKGKTKAQRAEHARKMAQKRWSKKKLETEKTS